MAKETLKRHNRSNTEWGYAQLCWTAVKNGDPIPPVPLYQIYQMYEVDESSGKEKLIKQLPITPMKVTYKGQTVFW